MLIVIEVGPVSLNCISRVLKYLNQFYTKIRSVRYFNLEVELSKNKDDVTRVIET